MKYFVLLTLVVASLLVGACAATSSSAAVAPVDSVESVLSTSAADLLTVAADGSAAIASVALEQPLVAMEASPLSDDEAAGLIYMREEEKLAHDVYVALSAEWGLPLFENIAASEQTHTDAVKRLLDGYGLEDLATANPGEFTNQTLQNLYDQLVEQGSKSLADALKVGAAIEEIDILDLEERIAQTDNADIALVYSNLLRGSQNHLRAFVSTLERQTGESYQPQYLSQASYDEIINSSNASGRRVGGRNSRGGR